jgi:uncharacterized protein YbaP (TraB family)
MKIRASVSGWLCGLCLLSVPAIPAQQDSQELLEEVQVVGEQPGPAMWRVSNGEHSLWIVGDLTPLPTRMTWRSREVERVVASSQEVLGPITVRATVKGGMFTMVRLLPSLMRLRNNADGATLKQILPADLHARWTATYRRYFGKDPVGLERWRPMFAADALFDRALQKSGLSKQGVVWPAMEKLAKKAKVPVRTREFNVTLDSPKQLIAEFAATPRAADIACLVATLDRIDADLPKMQQRAAAWAVGDVNALRKLPYVDQQQTCLEAAINGPKLRQMFEEQRKRVSEEMANAAGFALLRNQTTVAILPVANLLDENGALSILRKSGYLVEAPQ